MSTRVIKSLQLKVAGEHPHRDHRSKKGRTDYYEKVVHRRIYQKRMALKERDLDKSIYEL